ncbi:MAG: hypothetical protein LBS19_13080 [Clostridiales bacterium]|jgi:hypothetical protein|nr:hypothetical protein [Clostridiales bacterium]
MSELCPITLKQAQDFIKKHHRHNDPPYGHKLSIGLAEDGRLIGVVVLARPISRHLSDGYTAEVTRCCVLEGKRNANSKLYGAAVRAARAMGYRRVISYTLPSESGASLKAVGFHVDGITNSNKNGWDSPGRPRKKPVRYPTGRKVRWAISWADLPDREAGGK